MIYIAYDYNRKPVSIVCAKNKDLAVAFWQGRDIFPHSTACLEKDFTPIDEHITGVFPLLETKTVSLSETGSGPREYLIVKKA